MTTCTLSEILDRRESRQEKRNILLDRYHETLISFHLNIPGPIKDKLLYKVTLIEGHKSLMTYMKSRRIHVIHDAIEFHNTGPEAVLIVQHDPKMMKRLLVSFEEEHPLGRLFDLDVYTKEGGISRSDLGLEERRCYVCNDLAKACARSKRHDIKFVIRHIERMMKTFHSTESQGEIQIHEGGRR